MKKIYPLASLALALCPLALFAKKKVKPNILFIIVDDLRPELACYGIDEIKTPNIDRLAKNGVIFNNAYCNIPISGASRSSLLTGMYPLYPKRFTSFDARAEKEVPDAIPLSQHFKHHGYYTISNGKVSHNIDDNASAWSEYPWRTNPDGYGKNWAEYNKWELWMNSESGKYINPKTLRGPFCESADVEDTAYDDGKLTIRTIDDLRRLKKIGQPFFLACGFWKPHLPFNAPQKYWDVYNRNSIKLALNNTKPIDLPQQVKGSTEIHSYSKVPNIEDEAFQREAKHGYYACVSYVDAQIGLILDELERLELEENTIIVLIGDHGWHLGEYGFWGKHTLMNYSTRSPLIVKAPNVIPGKTESIVEFVDLYPTLCELSQIDMPQNQLQGKSFVSILKNKETTTKDYALIQWEKGVNIVSKYYSYTIWEKENNLTGEMLFDRVTDKFESINIAKKPKFRHIADSLNSQIKHAVDKLR